MQNAAHKQSHIECYCTDRHTHLHTHTYTMKSEQATCWWVHLHRSLETDLQVKMLVEAPRNQNAICKKLTQQQTCLRHIHIYSPAKQEPVLHKSDTVQAKYDYWFIELTNGNDYETLWVVWAAIMQCSLCICSFIICEHRYMCLWGRQCSRSLEI